MARRHDAARRRRCCPTCCPTDRLTASGMPVPDVRAELRRIHDLRNVGNVVLALAQPAATIGAAVWLDHPVAWVAAFVLMGPAFARFAILAHEAAHRLLFSNRRANDLVGRWLLAYPAFVPFDIYRRSHFAHHQRRVRARRARPQPLRRATRSPGPRCAASSGATPSASPGGRTCGPLLAGPAQPHGAARGPAHPRRPGRRARAARLVGRPELYLLLWLAPWMTVWRVINRLRAIAEHGGMTRSATAACTTHHVRQSLARPLLDRAVQHRLAPRPPRRHGRAVAEPAPRSTTSWSPPDGSPPASSTRATGRCGGPCGRRPAAAEAGRPWPGAQPSM